jgi:hypothetical protein
VKLFILIHKRYLINIWDYLQLWRLIGVIALFTFLTELFKGLIDGRKKKLSIRRKEILLKAVAQAIPVYAMSVFQRPIGVCKRMSDAIS